MKEIGKFPLWIETNEAYRKLLLWFFSYPNSEMGLNELSSKLKLSKTTVKKVFKYLSSESFLFKKIYGKKWVISCNKNHEINFTRKVAFNLLNVYEAYETGLREQIYKIVGNPKAVILFGSYRKGDDTEKSDIDIAVEVADNKELRIVKGGELHKVGYRKNVPVNLYIFSRNKIDLNLFANIANGIILEGFLEVRP